MSTFHELTTAQLRQALQLREQIDALQHKLGALLGVTGTAVPPKAKRGVSRPAGLRTMSTEGRAKISAAAKARWARVKGTSAKPVAKAKAAPAPKAAAAPKKRSGLTDEGRAKLATAMKERWAARKKGAPAPNASAK